MCKPLYATSML